MEIFLIRHAIAVERTTTLEDAARPLSQRGVRRFTREVSGLMRLEVRLDHIFHSPWLRAVQTAELLAPICAGALEATELLADDPGDDLLELARRFPKTARVAFIGHAPWMAELLSLLVIGTTRHADNMLFKKGGVAWLDGSPAPGKMRLCAMFPPRTLRGLGDPTGSDDDDLPTDTTD
jgi:phosphohistidine phosphatase